MSSDERKCGRASHAFAGFYTTERFSRDFFRFTNAQQTPRSTTCRTTTSVGHHGVLRAPFEKLPIEYTLMMLPASPPRRRAHRPRRLCHAMLHFDLTTHTHHRPPPPYTRFGQITCAGSENATSWGSILLVVTTQPTRAPRFAHMARAITIGCFVVQLVNLRPRSKPEGARSRRALRELS